MTSQLQPAEKTKSAPLHAVQLRAALRDKHAAPYLGISRAQLWRRAKNDPTFPQAHKLGPATTVWLVKDLDAFLARCAGEEG